MEGGSLFNPGILGTDFLWWIGQIADDSTWRDNIMAGKFKNKNTIPGWGRRYKVRIMGIHDQGQEAVPEADLPWANIMYPVTAGGGQTNSWMTSNLRQGTMVFGFWMDGKDMQVPIIMGCLGNNAQTPLGTKIGKEDNSVTNTQPGSLARSGYSKGAVPKTGTKKERVPDDGLITEKPVSEEISEESASNAPGVRTNQYGLNASRPVTQTQQNDIASAREQAQQQGLTGQSLQSFVKNRVQQGIRNRAGAARSPNGQVKPGPTIEQSDAMHLLNAGDVKREDKCQEKIVVMNPDSPVESATKAIQTEIDNLTAKADKFLGARKNYIDAVSGPPSQDDMDKEIRTTACKVAKFQKLIMEKVAEYDSKKMNLALATAVAEMPSAMRANFADQKTLNTENKIKEYNEITNKICDQMEGILRSKLNLPTLTAQADAIASSGILFSDSTAQSATLSLDLSSSSSPQTIPSRLGSAVYGGAGDDSRTDETSGSLEVESFGTSGIGASITEVTTPRVPMCYAEDVVAQVIVLNQDKIAGISSNQFRNYNRYINDLKSELEETDRRLAANAYDKTDLGKVLEISDEEEDDLPVGGTNYYSETGAPCAGGNGTGFKVDIVVPSGGWYDNGFATLNEGGAGYTVNTANGGGVSGTGSTTGATTTGGSGTGIKVNYTISSGVITGITTSAGDNGSNYENGDVLTIVNNASGTPSTNSTFTIDKVRGTVNTIANGGITIADPGVGYKMGDFLTVTQSGSGQNCGVMIAMVNDPGEKKATAGPVTPADTQGSVADARPGIGQQLSGMLNMLSGMQGSLTEALEFVNTKGNMFPFESVPNKAVSDFYTLARGGAGQPETETPSAMSIQKALQIPRNIPNPREAIPFAEPLPNMPSINLTSSQIGGIAADALGIDRGSTVEEVADAVKRARSRLDSGTA